MAKNNREYFTVVAVDGVTEGPKEDGKSGTVVVKLKIIDGPHAGEHRMYYGNLHENSVEYTFEHLRNLGWTCNDLEKLTGLGDIKATAVEEDDDYSGKRKVKYINKFQTGNRKLAARVPPSKGYMSKFKALAASIKVDIDREAAKAPSREELATLKPTATEPAEDNPFA